VTALNERGRKICISETAKDRPALQLITNMIYEILHVLSTDTESNDIGLPWTTLRVLLSFCVFSLLNTFQEQMAAKLQEIDWTTCIWNF